MFSRGGCSRQHDLTALQERQVGVFSLDGCQVRVRLNGISAFGWASLRLSLIRSVQADWCRFLGGYRRVGSESDLAELVLVMVVTFPFRTRGSGEGR